MIPGTELIVKTGHQSNYPNPIKFSKGDNLTVGQRDTQYQGWIWATNAAGVSGWVPVQFLEIDGIDAVALVDYDATELTVSEGETVTLVHTLNEWGWVRTEQGLEGWVPLENLAEM